MGIGSMIRKKNRMAFVASICVLLSSCRQYMKIFQSTGEWLHEDLMYFKNEGTKENECDPIGWMKIGDQKIDFVCLHMVGAQVWFMQSDETYDTVGDVLWEATAVFTFNGNIKISNFSNYTKTYVYTGDTKFILRKLNS